MAVIASPSVRRLAQYRPFERGGLDLRAVLQDLALAATAINGGHMESVFAYRQAFGDLWSLDVEIEELRPALADLVDKGSLTTSDKGFLLSNETANLLNARAGEWDEIEEHAFREWALAVRNVRPALTDEEIDLLQQDLKEWLHDIIARHGAEATLMLYPEQKRAQRFFEDIDARGFERLPERSPDLQALRDQALPLFIRSPTPDQRHFLAGLLNTSFYMCVLTIDPSAKQLVQDQMKGRRIYLDTNFLYAILGAASPDEVYSSRRLMQLCRDLGFELAITPWTMDELRTSIAGARREVDAQQAFVRPDLAETMLRLSGDKGFTRFLTGSL